MTDRTVCKDASQERQKRMIADHFTRLARSPDTGEKCAYNVCAGQPDRVVAQLRCAAGAAEINALQCGMRGKSREYIMAAEKLGHSEDVCTYVKCDVGDDESRQCRPDRGAASRPRLAAAVPTPAASPS